MNCDMIVNLTALPPIPEPKIDCKIKRALFVDRDLILDFIKTNFDSTGWMAEAEKALLGNPGRCFIATYPGEILGFACYDSTALGFFGPTGVRDDLRGKGVGATLLVRTLHAMREAGYGYAIIGASGVASPFYEKIVGARNIVGGETINSVYSQMVKF